MLYTLRSFISIFLQIQPTTSIYHNVPSLSELYESIYSFNIVNKVLLYTVLFPSKVSGNRGRCKHVSTASFCRNKTDIMYFEAVQQKDGGTPSSYVHAWLKLKFTYRFAITKLFIFVSKIDLARMCQLRQTHKGISRIE